MNDGPAGPTNKGRIPPHFICLSIYSIAMNQTVDIARGILADPPKEVLDVMRDAKTTDEARAAVAEVSPSPLLAQPVLVNGSSSSASLSAPTNKAGEGRLQVVDEDQTFT